MSINLILVAQHDTTLVDREETPRMPWHDMSCAVVSSFAIVWDGSHSHAI